jgi:hypothetical protein
MKTTSRESTQASRDVSPKRLTVGFDKTARAVFAVSHYSVPALFAIAKSIAVSNQKTVNGASIKIENAGTSMGDFQS